jgi:hypothetical protein
MQRAAWLSILSLVAGQAHAQDNSYGYLGAVAGSFDYEEDISDFAPGVSFSDSATAVELYGGYRFNEWFAIEGRYGATDTLGESATLQSIFGPVPAELGIDFQFLTVNALGHIAFDNLTLLGGIGYWDADITSEIDANVPGFGQVSLEFDDSDTGIRYTLGLEWAFDPFALRVQYDLFDIDNADASMIGIGAHWVFGR